MTEKQPIQPTPVGALRFNTDTALLEYFDGNQYVNITIDSPEVNTGGTRGITAGAYPNGNQMDFFNIDSTGNSVDFGNRSISAQQPGSAASRTRGCIAGGYSSSDSNIIDFVTMSSQGDAVDFGDLTLAGHGVSMCINDSTRGVFAGRVASPAKLNVIDYITIAQTGNAVDFGDISTTIRNAMGGSSPTRGVFALGGNPSTNTIEFLTISTLGNTADFGDLLFTGRYGCGGSNAIRCLITKGNGSVNTVNFVTIATLGDASDFGDLTQTSSTQLPVMCTSSTRAVRVGGQDPAFTDTMDYAQIMTTGNFIDFGDAVESKSGRASLSNGHGGLG